MMLRQPQHLCVMMMMITAFGATNVPAATTKIKLTITEIKKTIKKTIITINAFHHLPPLHQKDTFYRFISTQKPIRGIG